MAAAFCDFKVGEIVTPDAPHLDLALDPKLAWALRNRAQFEPAIRRAWAALVGCVTPEGRLTHVQPIGADPRKLDENATEVYGVGAFLLAGSEVYRLAE